MLFVTEKYVTIFGNGVAITLLAKTLLRHGAAMRDFRCRSKLWFSGPLYIQHILC